LQKASYYKTFLNTLNADSNEDSYLRELVAEGFSQNMGRSYEEALDEIEEQYYHNHKQLVTDYEETFGTGSSAGMSKDAMRANLAKNKMLENEESEFESLIRGLNKIEDEDTKNKYAALLSLSTGQVTTGMENLTGEGDLNEMLSVMGFTTPE
jgi:hypothetical protein